MNARLAGALKWSADLAEAANDDLRRMCEENSQIGSSVKSDVPGVYVVRAARFVKVGISRSTKFRMEEIQCGCPYPAEMVFFVRHPRARLIERKVHKALIASHSSGEWFRVTAKTAIAEVRRQIKLVDSGTDTQAPVITRQERAPRRRRKTTPLFDT